jgi:hypothetical protein
MYRLSHNSGTIGSFHLLYVATVSECSELSQMCLLSEQSENQLYALKVRNVKSLVKVIITTQSDITLQTLRVNLSDWRKGCAVCVDTRADIFVLSISCNSSVKTPQFLVIADITGHTIKTLFTFRWSLLEVQKWMHTHAVLFHLSVYFIFAIRVGILIKFDNRNLNKLSFVSI